MAWTRWSRHWQLSWAPQRRAQRGWRLLRTEKWRTVILLPFLWERGAPPQRPDTSTPGNQHPQRTWTGLPSISLGTPSSRHHPELWWRSSLRTQWTRSQHCPKKAAQRSCPLPPQLQPQRPAGGSNSPLKMPQPRLPGRDFCPAPKTHSPPRSHAGKA